VVPFQSGYINLAFMLILVARDFSGEAWHAQARLLPPSQQKVVLFFFYTAGSVLKAITGLQYLPAISLYWGDTGLP